MLLGRNRCIDDHMFGEFLTEDEFEKASTGGEMELGI